MTMPVWITSNDLGTYYTGVTLSIQLDAASADTVNYVLLRGPLPTGLVISNTGVISGIPADVLRVTTSNFIIRATNSSNILSFSDKSFNISIARAQPQWVTSGELGTFPNGIAVSIILGALPAPPAVSVVYKLLNGALPSGLSLSNDGRITGTPASVTQVTSTSFTIRATDNLLSIRDRTFTMSISGSEIPAFITQSGELFTAADSTWCDYQILYSNLSASNEVAVRLIGGSLPAGLEIDYQGVIRGYPSPPIINTATSAITARVYATQTTGVITCDSTQSFSVGRPITFAGIISVNATTIFAANQYIITTVGTTDFTLLGASSNAVGVVFTATADGNSGSGTGTASIYFGGISSSIVYYVHSVVSSTQFTISSTQNGYILSLNSSANTLTVTLPEATVGFPTTRTSTFTLSLVSKLGGNTAIFSIVINNQQLPPSLPDTRPPTILNTRPLTYIISDADPYAGYYIHTPTPAPTVANIGVIASGEYFAFKIIGYDFDADVIEYVFTSLPLGLVADTVSGWITGTPTVTAGTISTATFSVFTRKIITPTIVSPVFNFEFTVSDLPDIAITWVTAAALGTIFNATISQLAVKAVAAVALEYRLTAGTLPPGVTLANTGEIIGRVANEVSSEITAAGALTVFAFTIEAYSPAYPTILTSRDFTVTIQQEYTNPTDILYIKATPSIKDRRIIETLLTNPLLIATADLYRPTDYNFGKASGVIYEHCYGIYSSDIAEYIAAVTKNHYNRNITLGEIKTARALDSQGNPQYEVVYSEIIDDLVAPSGLSIPKQIYWPTPIDLFQGAWYTSSTSIFTSWELLLDQKYFTSLTPGYARTLYPNSLVNMRTQVADVLGQDKSNTLLPSWMTSPQTNGAALGFTAAWVIAYTLPGKSAQIASNIQTNWPHTLNEINFQIDRFLVDKSGTYNFDNYLVPPAWTGLPSAIPIPSPRDSKDFPVLFPQPNILPLKSQY
jgi:hypothetical protein